MKLLIMYLICSVNIAIGNKAFYYVSECKINSSWRNLTDTATITMPRKISEERFEELVEPGNKVTIALGYNGKLFKEFEGYVSRVKPGIPVVVECEDEMYQLKRDNFTKSWENASLHEVVRYVAGSYDREVVDAQLGPFQIQDASAAKVLQHIKDNFSLPSFFHPRDGKLYVGYRYPDFEPRTGKYHFQRNIVDSANLEYRRADEVDLKVKAISMQPDGSRLTTEVGDDGGSTRTLHFYNLNEQELVKRAKEEMSNIQLDGFAGTFTAFGYPWVQHGDIANLKDPWYPERNGEYLIDAVRTSMGSGGYRRVIELGKTADV